MDFAHDTEVALMTAAALINTAGEPDTLSTVQDLTAFYRDQGWTGSRVGDTSELEQVRALRPRLRALWVAEVEELVEGVNALLREAQALPQVVRHGGYDWHLHATGQHQPLSTRMSVEAAMALVDVIRMGESQRLRVCVAPDCDDVFMDLSRNRSRRFSDVTCSNRVAAAAYRSRQSDQDDE
jgi:predicted RNA-binding Zn ribbon-like protein